MAIEKNEHWVNFINLYKNLPELWNVKSGKYKNKTIRTKAYEKLTIEYKNIDKNTTIEKVKNRLRNMRIAYRRELKKKISSEKSDVGVDDLYEPNLWYFYDFNFLKEFELPEEGIRKKILTSKQDESPRLSNDTDESSVEEMSFPVVNKRAMTPPSSNKRASPTIRVKKSRTEPDELLELAAKRLKKSDDYSQTLANVWASEFRLASEDQRFFAKKAIDDILYEARLGTLHRNSVKINADPPTITVSNNTLVSTGRTSSSNRGMQSQDDYDNYDPLHVPNRRRPSQLSSLKSENFNRSYTETFHDSSNCQYSSITIEPASIDPDVSP